MRAALECYPCFFTQILKTAQLLSLSEEQTREAVRRFSRLLPEFPAPASPAAIGREVYLILADISGVKDPYRELKQHCTRLALEMVPELKERIKKADDPLREALRIAVAGNFIDFGTSLDINLKSGLDKILEQDFLIDFYAELRRHLERAKSVLMLGDNAGETVFDRLLIEELAVPVTYVVREAPMINDALAEDAEMAGIGEVARIVSSGCVAPGTIREFCSPEFWQMLTHAELIISKGQGNYEGLSHESLPIFYLLKAKCKAVARDIGVPVGSMLLLGDAPQGATLKT